MGRRSGVLRALLRLSAAALLIGSAVITAAPAAAADPPQAADPPLAAQPAATADSFPQYPASFAETPPMGFNDWNAYGCNISEDIIRAVALAMHTNGMQDAGYQYVNIDDCWQDGRTLSGAAKLLKARVNGHLVADPVFFPSGPQALADYVHSLGLKFGLYSSNGTATCQNVSGTFGYETVDALDYAAWGVDYFKLDTCNSGLPSDPKAFYTRYRAFSEALMASGRDIVYSLCDFTQGGQTWLWGSQLGNLWRTTGDISANFNSMLNNMTSTQTRRTYAGPGHWNDPDMLEIGTGSFSTLAGPAAAGDTNVSVASASNAIAGSAFRVGTAAGGDLESAIVTSVGTAAGAATTIFSDAAAGDANVKVNSVTGFTVGQRALIDTGGNTETPTVSAVGTAGTATTLAAPGAPGDTNVKVASITNLAAGDALTIDNGANLETATIAGVGTAAGAATTAVAPTASGDTNVKVASVNGFVVGQPMLVENETTTVASIGTAAGSATTIVVPVVAGDTTVKVANVTGFVVGQPLVIDTGAAYETASVTSIGTAAGSATTTVAPVFIGDTNVKVSNVNGFVVGNKVEIHDAGSLPLGTPTETALILGVGTAAGPQTTSVSPNVPGDTNVKVASINGFVVGQPMQIKDASGANFETAVVAAIGTAAGASTTLAAASAVGGTNLKVTSVSGFVVGQQLAVGVGATEELATVAAVGTAGAGGTGIDLTAPLAKDHLILMLIRGLGTGIDLAGPLTIAHPSGSTTRGQGTGITVSPITMNHPLTTFGSNPGQGVTIRDTGTGITLASPLTLVHANATSIRGAGTGITLATPLSSAHAGGVAARGTGTGVTLTAPLSLAHATAAAVRDQTKPGTGITFSPALGSAHAINAVARGAGTGITLATPLTLAHPANTAIGKSGMTIDESKSHFSLWSMMAAPLLAGTDVANMAKENLAIYLNKDVIGVDQDALGVQAFTVTNASSHWILTRPLADGDTAVALFNASATPWTGASATFAQLGLTPGATYIARDLWTHTDATITGDTLSAGDIPGHATVMYRIAKTLSALSPVHAFVGLKNSDDQGTNVDVYAELLQNGATVASGLTRCVSGITRNPALAKEVVVDWAPFAPVPIATNDVFALRLSTRIGTTASDAKCAGHGNATGLRAYYDSTKQPARFDLTLDASASSDEWLHSNGAACVNAPSVGATNLFFDPTAPTATAAKCKDAGSINFAGGNPWKVLGTWTMP